MDSAHSDRHSASMGHTLGIMPNV